MSLAQVAREPINSFSCSRTGREVNIVGLYRDVSDQARDRAAAVRAKLALGMPWNPVHVHPKRCSCQHSQSGGGAEHGREHRTNDSQSYRRLLSTHMDLHLGPTSYGRR